MTYMTDIERQIITGAARAALESEARPPAGRTEVVLELLRRGDITADQARGLLESPELEASIRDATTARREYLEWLLELEWLEPRIRARPQSDAPATRSSDDRVDAMPYMWLDLEPHQRFSGLEEWAGDDRVDSDPLDAVVDGVTLRDLLDRDRARRQEDSATAWRSHVRPTPAQRAAVSAHWSAELRAK